MRSSTSMYRARFRYPPHVSIKQLWRRVNGDRWRSKDYLGLINKWRTPEQPQATHLAPDQPPMTDGRGDMLVYAVTERGETWSYYLLRMEGRYILHCEPTPPGQLEPALVPTPPVPTP
jgi:hypothetical protein